MRATCSCRSSTTIRATRTPQWRQDLDAVGFVALGYEAALARSATIEIALDLFDGERQSGRAAVDDDTHAATMRLAECGDAKDRAEGAGHVVPAKTSTRKLAGDEPMRRA
jgi:hypothetical protein